MIEKQVNARLHYLKRYLTLPRAVTHWHQASEVSNITPDGGSVLEIGVGSGHTTWLLRQWGYRVTTVDFDPELRPDIVADVRELPLDSGSYDCVLAAEVLEHLPFEDFATTLIELRRVSRGIVIVTLPAPFLGLAALLNLPGLEPIGVFLGVPYWTRHRWNGEHYWELGKRGYGLGRVRHEIAMSGLHIRKGFRPAPSLYCYFFILSVD